MNDPMLIRLFAHLHTSGLGSRLSSTQILSQGSRKPFIPILSSSNRYISASVKLSSSSPKVFLLKTPSKLKLESRATVNPTASTSTMSSSRDVSVQSDITKMKPESDGTFKRKASTFRDTIEKGGKFEPEKGMCKPSL